MVAKFFLRYLAQFVYLRNVPILGDLLHWLSYRLLHPTKSIWVQVRKGIGNRRADVVTVVSEPM